MVARRYNHVAAGDRGKRCADAQAWGGKVLMEQTLRGRAGMTLFAHADFNSGRVLCLCVKRERVQSDFLILCVRLKNTRGVLFLTTLIFLARGALS